MTTSQHLFERAQRVIPGGVNSPVRAFAAVGGCPIFIKSGAGARLTTVENRELLDFCGSWGALLLGHAHPAVVEAVYHAAERGTTFGANTKAEVEFAETLCAAVPTMEQVRLVNSGTEATMTALRLARGATGRSKILKFDGCYHGHADYLLVAAGSGLLTAGVASSAGVATAATNDVLVAPYNDSKAVEKIMTEHGDDLAAVIVEPIAGNMGLIEPEPEFLQTLRKLTRENGAILIFDEVISGFRLAPTTYGTIAGIQPDLTCLGKIIGGGLPIGAVGGHRKLMRRLAPTGDVYQAGTLSGNPVAVAAGLATLKVMKKNPPYAHIRQLSCKLVAGVKQAAENAGQKIHVASKDGMFTIFFQAEPARNLHQVKRSDTAAYARFFHNMLDAGFYLPPSQFEVNFISAAHNESDIGAFVDAATKAFQS